MNGKELWQDHQKLQYNEKEVDRKEVNSQDLQIDIRMMDIMISPDSQ